MYLVGSGANNSGKAELKPAADDPQQQPHEGAFVLNINMSFPLRDRHFPSLYTVMFTDVAIWDFL